MNLHKIIRRFICWKRGFHDYDYSEFDNERMTDFFTCHFCGSVEFARQFCERPMRPLKKRYSGNMISVLQNYLPTRVKNTLKPYYRTVFPNQLCIMILPTMRCNYKCSYCKWHYSIEEVPLEVWQKALRKFPKANIYISGGEPFLYKDLPELVSEFNIMGIVTNGSLDIDVYKKIKKRIHLNVSYHREQIDILEFYNKIIELRKLFHLTVTTVATRDTIPIIPGLKKLFPQLHIDPLIGFKYTIKEEIALLKDITPDRTLDKTCGFKKCSAGKNYIVIMPDCSVVRCLGGMYSLGNIIDKDFKLGDTITCSLPCVACDKDMAKKEIVRVE